MTSSPSRLRTVVVVLAGGSGSRVGLDVPKQLLKVAGRTILEHTVDAVHSCPEVDEVLLVMAAEHIPAADAMLDRQRYPKLGALVPGGRDRTESTLAALEALGDQELNVLFHDAVRPLVSRRVLQDCVAALETYQAVDVAIPSADTIVRVDQDDDIVDIPDRQWLRRGQTPQGFRLSVIRRAYEIARTLPDLHVTDDCGVVLRCLPEVPIHVVRGDEQNMKVTYPVDLFLIDKLFQLASHEVPPRTAEQAGSLAGRTVVVLGGSYGIGADIATLAEAEGCRVFSFGRSSTGTHVEDPADVASALQQAHDATGRIDAVVLTAAVLHRGRLDQTSDDDVQRQVAINYLAPVQVARAALPYLAETSGHLLFFTSSSYTRGRADYALYSSTKAAVVNLAQALADEWSGALVKVNVINPERTHTPMRVKAFGQEPEDSLLTSESVANAALDLLVSDMTGHVIDVRMARNSPTGFDPRVPQPTEGTPAVYEVGT